MQVQDIHEVADLAAPRQGQDLVGGRVRVMQTIAAEIISLNREEAVGAVMCPLDFQLPP